MERFNCRVLYYILFELFGKYPYLIRYLNVQELAKELDISIDELRKILKELQRKALKIEERKKSKERQQLLKEIKESYIYLEEIIGS